MEYDSIDEFSKRHLLDVDIDCVSLYCSLRKYCDSKLYLYARSGKRWALSASGEDRVEVQQALNDFSMRLTSSDFASNTKESNAVLFVECTSSKNERAYRETQDEKFSKENSKRQSWANVWVVVGAVLGTIAGVLLTLAFTKK
ncbi:MAG: hypothetical protein GX647_08565 [Clostridiales bacterium]|nr:hypothetical protein [Clostridiales bacterium]